MPDQFIHETAIVKNSDLGSVKIYRNAVINNCVFADGCSVGDDTTIERCKFENNVVINRRSYINDSEIGCFSYTGINTTMNWTSLGRFCSLARNVDIGGFDHDYKKITTMPAFRFAQTVSGGGKLNVREEHEKCIIGNDVWIAAGAQIMHKVTVGDGAVIGGGAVVTHDVPPYAIVVGVPAKIIGFRCEENLISDLLSIRWWDWPQDVLLPVMNEMIQRDISRETIDWMKSYYKK